MRAGRLTVKTKEITAVNMEKIRANDLVLRENSRRPSKRVLEGFSFNIMGSSELSVFNMMENGS